MEQCDGEWEHGQGVRISTLDNPGWLVDIRVHGTDLEHAVFEPLRIDRTEDDWIHCRVEEKFFKGRCDPVNLDEMLTTFRKWAEGQPYVASLKIS
jgi:hypothetical protein